MVKTIPNNVATDGIGKLIWQKQPVKVIRSFFMDEILKSWNWQLRGSGLRGRVSSYLLDFQELDGVFALRRKSSETFKVSMSCC